MNPLSNVEHIKNWIFNGVSAYCEVLAQRRMNQPSRVTANERIVLFSRTWEFVYKFGVKKLLAIVKAAGVSTRVVQTSKNTALLRGSDCLVGSHLSTTQTRAYVTVSVTLSFLVWSVTRHPYDRKIEITFMFNV